MGEKLTKEEISLLNLSKEKTKDIIQLSGKPSTNIQEFIRKFFSKKTTLLGIFVFLGLIIAAFIIQYNSPFSATKTITNDRVDIIRNVLPSSFDGGWSEIIIENDFDKNKWINILGASNFKSSIVNGVEIGKINITGFINDNGQKGSLILGTNAFGQDNWTRLWVGLLSSLKLALFVSSVEFFIGFVIGAFIGFHAGSKLDTYLMRVVDTIRGVPTLIWFILFAFILGTGFWELSLALISIGWIAPLYLTRMYIIRVKDLEFIQAAKTIGVPKYKLIFKHAIPNILGRIISSFVRRIPFVIFAQASLAFLGLVSPNAVDLGAIINDSRDNLDNWLNILVPTIVIFSLTLSVQFIANGINDSLEIKGDR